jgi:hypothetical protein
MILLQSEIGVSGSGMGDGTDVLDIPEAGIKITPPLGWVTNKEVANLTLVIKEPGLEQPVYDKPKYQRNITLMTIHEPSPIDDLRSKELGQYLLSHFKESGIAKDFKIIEAKLFDFRGKNDGILVYSSLTIGDYPMMQTHVLVSGAERQYLMTYTDLAERFSQANDYGFAAAWSSMVSLEVVGVAPSRMSQHRTIYLSAAALGLILTGLALWGFKRARTSYRHFADLAVSGKDLEDDDLISNVRSGELSAKVSVPKKAKSNRLFKTRKKVISSSPGKCFTSECSTY